MALTGATGFIGKRLTQRLLEAGAGVRILVRTPSAASQLQQLGAEVVAGDLADEHALNTLLAGADSLVHCAGAVRGASYAAFEVTNVIGTARLLKIARSQPRPPRVLMLSSIVAREPQLSWYARSKREGEDLLTALGGQLDWTVLRPPAVYGPGDKEMLPVFQSMTRGIAPLPGSPTSRTSLIHVDDLVDACLACLTCDGKTSRQRIYLHDGQENGYNWEEMARIAEGVFARRVRLLPIPSPILNSFAAINLASARLTGRAPMLTPRKLRELRHPDWVADNAIISTATGWNPQIDLRQGLTLLKNSAL